MADSPPGPVTLWALATLGYAAPAAPFCHVGPICSQDVYLNLS